MSHYADLGLPLVHVGKVRELYRTGTNLLMVATDNVSAFDQVLEVSVPDKGVLLTQLSLWWFDQLADIVDNHVHSTTVPDAVAGRAVEVEELDMVPVECVVRGYLTGSALLEYQRTGAVCGIPLPMGLRNGDQLPEPIFTPAVKAAVGEHDENITFERLVELHGAELAAELRRLTLAIYARATGIASRRGIIIADTKFEFGRRQDGTLVLGDEVLTPDSSRFWDASTWRPGEAIESFDKQYLRDWLTEARAEAGSDDESPLSLPPEVVEATRSRYIAAYEKLTGKRFRYDESMTTVVVNVMPKPEILDPQGKAVTGALARLGFSGISVRQGRRFEVTFEGEATDEQLAKIREAADKLLANPVIESYEIVVGG